MEPCGRGSGPLREETRFRPEAMTSLDLRESRSMLVLMSLLVVTVLAYGTLTWLTQLE